METAINWFAARLGKVTYSMQQRNGPFSYDCSSSIYYSLIAQGIFPASIWIGNTDSMFRDLPLHGFSEVPADANGFIATKRGDIFIWGVKGQSGGASGHTGIFVNENDIIHCNAGYDGITINNHDQIAGWNGWPNLTVFRLTGNKAPTGNQVDQIVEVGSYIKFDGIYTADDVQLIGKTWQVRTNQLCHQDFAWEDNGIPASVLVEVDDKGYATADQELSIGSLYKIPGKFEVLDIGEMNGRWLAQVGAGGMRFWVDIETATEIKSDDPGTPSPVVKQDQPIVVAEPPKTSTPTPVPVVEPGKPVESPVKTTDGYTEQDRQLDRQTNELAMQILTLVKELLKLAKSIWGSLTSLHKKVKK
jgi:hypothetical protein